MELNPGFVFDGLQHFAEGCAIHLKGDTLIILFNMDTV